MTAPSLRLFFALWPGDTTRAALDALVREVAVEARARAVAADNLHLTLAFLGERPASMLPDLCASVSAIEVVPFSLPLDDIGCWRKTGIAWAGATARVPQLFLLRERVVQALATVRIVIDERRFMPHVTLARRAQSLVTRRLVPPIAWRVESFSLVASILDPRGVRYEVLRSWPDAVTWGPSAPKR